MLFLFSTHQFLFRVTGGAVDYPCTDCLEGKEINTDIQTYSTEVHSYLRVILSLCSPPDCGWKQAPMKKELILGQFVGNDNINFWDTIWII